MLIEIEKKEVKHDTDALLDMQGLLFCAEALSSNKDDRRRHMKELRILDGVVCAMDGARVHKYKMRRPIDDGFYKVLMAKKTHLILHPEDDYDEYPNFDLDGLKQDPVNTATVHNSNGGFSSAVAKIIRTLPDDAAINVHFVKPLDGSWDMGVYPGNIMKFKCSDGSGRSAIIMSMMA